MPFQHFEYDSPFQMLMSGAQGYNTLKDTLQKSRMNPLLLERSKLENALNAQKQKQQDIYLQQYPELLAAELMKSKLEPEEMRARTGLMGGQLRELEQKMKYSPELYSAEAAERRAKADDLTRRNQLIQELLRGNIPGQSQQVPRGTLNEPMQSVIPQQGAMRPTASNGMSYAQAALLSDQLGLPKPEILDIDGQKIAATAFGNIPIAQGKTPEEKAFATTLGAEKGKSYSGLVSAYQGMANQGAAIDEMINLSLNDPEFKNVTGPVGSFLAKWTGSPERKELLGRLQSSSGEIALQVAPSLKGAFTGRDQTLINTIKANPNSDFPDVFIGKLKAQKLMNSVLQDRAEKAAKYMEQGDSQLEAIKKATKETPLENYRNQVEDMVNPIRQEKVVDGKTYYLRANGKVYE